MTMLRRLGRAFLMDSNVLRPMMTECPVVMLLKCFKSADSLHISALLCPMTLFSAAATMMDSVISVN